MDVTPIIVAGASFAVVAAIACALLAVAILVVTVRSREGSGSGIGCALLGLLWAGIAALLLWLARG